MKVSVLKGFARHAVRLAVLLVLVSGMAVVSQAQASGAADQSTIKAAAPAAASERVSPAALAPGKSQPRGNHEGITVHGHWTIEVRNPDGKLVTHREFENALQNGPGAQLLTGLLGRTLVTGSWEITLATNGGSMHITEPNTTQSSVCSYAACSPNLSVVAGTAVNPGVLTFTGFVSVPAGQTSISSVLTDNIACIPTVLPSACLTTPVTGVNNGTSTDFGLTQATLSPAITITPGQVVQATVNISFQ